MVASKSSKAEKYANLLAKMKAAKGDSGFWKPKEGSNTIRILPEVGTMETFFVVAGTHYLGADQVFACAHINSDEQVECPLCEVNRLLWRAGEQDEAKKWRAGKSFLMNVIVRGEEKDGPQIYAAPKTVLDALYALIMDPEIGDVSDPEEGYDIKIERTGKDITTKYSVREAKNPSPLSADADDIEKWLNDAEDLEAYRKARIPNYAETAKKSGASVFLELDDDDEEDADAKSVEEEFEGEEDIEEDEVEETPVKASDVIRDRIGGRTLNLGKRR